MKDVSPKTLQDSVRNNLADFDAQVIRMNELEALSSGSYDLHSELIAWELRRNELAESCRAAGIPMKRAAIEAFISGANP